MNTRQLTALVCFGGFASAGWADASYQESVQITGGQLVDTVKSIPFMPKSIQKMLAPTVTKKLLHGNQLASVSPSSTEIIDLDQETITRIDAEKKTYSVTTFAQMRKAIEDAPKKLQDAQAKAKQNQGSQRQAAPADSQAPQVQVTYEVSVSDGGPPQMVNGVMAKEQILTMKAHFTDPNAQPSAGPNTVTYTYISDIWTTPEPPEMKQVDEFYQRYGKKLMQGVDTAALVKSMQPALNGAALAPLFASNPNAGPALQEVMAKMATEMQKIKGTRVLEVARFGGEALTATPGAPPPPPEAAPPPQQSGASKLGALGAAFGKSVLGLGSLHRGTDQPPPDAAPASQSAMLFESTTQKSGFSAEPVTADAFQIPPGFSKVASPSDP
jgi:hypothetical protein